MRKRAALVRAAVAGLELRHALRGLSGRIVTLFLALLLIVQLAGFGVIGSGIERNARALLTSELEVGERVFMRLLEQNTQKLLQGATLLAADYGFRSAIGSNDADTIRSALDNHGARIGATVSALLDAQLALRAASAVDDASLAALRGQLAARAALGGVAPTQAATIALVDARPVQFVMVPIKAPLLIGWVVMGFPIDQALVDDMRSLYAVHVAVLTQPGGGAAQVAATTLGAAASREIARAEPSAQELDLAGEAMVARTLRPAPDGVAMRVVLLRPVAEVVAPYRRLQWLLAVITGIGVLVFALGSVITARRVTRPLRSLAGAADRLAGGDYDTPLQAEHTARRDELGELAQAFDHMRVRIAAHQREIEQLAYWDRLTGLPNRVQFRSALAAALARHAGSEIGPAVIMLDLDRFKQVNDVLGYATGDALLQGVAQRLVRDVVRGGDLVARLGSDVFAILLAQAAPALAKSVAERVVRAFEQPIVVDDQPLDVAAGIGIASHPLHGDDADTLLNRAEIAMVTAKRKQSGPVLYDASIDLASAQTLSLLTELRRALERDELQLYLQPKVELATGRVSGAEALVRWRHPTRGMVPPMEFIPFAEQTGFIRELTLWVFAAAARHWSQLASEGHVLRISLNLSARDLLDAQLPEKFDVLRARYQVPTSALCLEITESAIMDDPSHAQQTLLRLHERGYRLSIDDFGTGYSSLAYLKRLPVDELKIDKSFVMGMEQAPDDAAIVRSTIDLAHNLALSVVAEGVENATVLELLRALQCEEVQGYHLSRPLPVTEFSAWCSAWAARWQAPAPERKPDLSKLH